MNPGHIGTMLEDEWHHHCATLALLRSRGKGLTRIQLEVLLSLDRATPCQQNLSLKQLLDFGVLEKDFA